MLFILYHHADIDECSMHPESCLNGRCVNMDGGWRCECNPGYILDETQAYCIGMCIWLKNIIMRSWYLKICLCIFELCTLVMFYTLLCDIAFPTAYMALHFVF